MLSDIHSNVFALQAVLRDAELSDVVVSSGSAEISLATIPGHPIASSYSAVSSRSPSWETTTAGWSTARRLRLRSPEISPGIMPENWPRTVQLPWIGWRRCRPP